MVEEALEQATLAGGCFWCLEAAFQSLRGVVRVEAGYAGGGIPAPTYEQICTGTTGHAEAVRITFDPRVISYRQLLGVFFAVHDPTTPNRQGADVGTQYRSIIFCHNLEQKALAEQVIGEFVAAGVWAAPIVTEVIPSAAFYPAEDYHRDYYRRNPDLGYCRAVIAPKLSKLRREFTELQRGS